MYHHKIQHLINQIKVVLSERLTVRDHHFLGENIPKSYIFEMQVLLQIYHMKLCIGPAQFVKASYIDASVPDLLIRDRAKFTEAQFIFLAVVLPAVLITLFSQFLPNFQLVPVLLLLALHRDLILFPVFGRHHTGHLFKGAVECRGCRKSAVHGDLCQILL